MLAGLSAKLHVFVERPLALTVAGAQKLIKAAQRNDRLIMVGANHRYRPDIQQIRSCVQNGELGDLESIRALVVPRAGRPGRRWVGARSAELAGGGAMFDLGLSLLDLSLWLTGFAPVTRVSAVYPAKGREKGIEPSGTAMVALEGGAAISSRRLVALRRAGRAVRAGDSRLQGVGADQSAGHLEGFSRHGAGRGPVRARTRGRRRSRLGRGLNGRTSQPSCGARSKAPALAEQLTVLKVMEAIYESAEQEKDIVP